MLEGVCAIIQAIRSTAVISCDSARRPGIISEMLGAFRSAADTIFRKEVLMNFLNKKASGYSLLYVEDDLLVRRAVWLLLKIHFPGMEIHLAENGQVGLNMFHKYNPHIVMTDINMPVMNGIIMATQILALNTDAKIIILTAFSEESSMVDLLNSGVSRIVTKPITTNLLFEAIEDCLAASN